MNTLNKRNATTWIHAWATGFQALTFDSDAHAIKWAKANGCKYVGLR